MSAQTHDLQPTIVTPDDATRIEAFGGVITTLRAEHSGGEQEVMADWICDLCPASASDLSRAEE